MTIKWAQEAANYHIATLSLKVHNIDQQHTKYKYFSYSPLLKETKAPITLQRFWTVYY